MDIPEIAQMFPDCHNLGNQWLMLLGDSFTIMDAMIANRVSVPLIFSDPPYFLSNDGVTCHSGKMVSVNKGQWDKSDSFQATREFHKQWIEKCLALLTPDGTMWVSATQHSIFIIGNILQEYGCPILNTITWEKPNPPPNLSCRYFTHSTEFIIWAKKNKKAKHCFNYDVMKEQNQGKQMKTVWRMSVPSMQEKSWGHHPTQKPLELLRRIIMSSSQPGDIVFDPFAGSSTTGVAALELDRMFIGVENDPDYQELSTKRLKASERF